mmetsp:Transcript_27764/g.43071  ORF Transcript_27764/g.43071 Transcript_27764/m.43071 type:complete len:83 (-) Transcript_27764:198-446(-)
MLTFKQRKLVTLLIQKGEEVGKGCSLLCNSSRRAGGEKVKIVGRGGEPQCAMIDTSLQSECMFVCCQSNRQSSERGSYLTVS